MNLLRLALVFGKIGAVVFGGGFVMIPFIQREVVQHYGWLTQQQFVDAIALGQITPGPILISATFIGYTVQGLTGAVVATLAVFLPSFLMTALAARQLARLRRNPRIAGFLRGVLPAVVAMLLMAAITIGRATLWSDWRLLLLALAALVLLVRFKVDAVYVVVGAGVTGFLIER
ncbi:MAG: chromate transporter [Armatimonadota bacterium]|jgi:chromate transporter